MFGSIRTKARRNVRRHVSENSTLSSYRRGRVGRIVDFFFKDRGPIWFVGLYLATVVVILSADFLPSVHCPGLPQYFSSDTGDVGSMVDEINRIFLTVQATLIGLIFPIAIALVALLLQQRSQTSSSSRVGIYYQESRAFEIGSSSIMLIVVLTIQQFWPVLIPASILSEMGFPTPNTMFTQVALTGTHGFWLVLNALAILQFMLVSLTFVNPKGQQFILRRFVARESVPRNLEDQLACNYSSLPEFFGLLPHTKESSDSSSNEYPSVRFWGMGSDVGVIEVEHYHTGTQILHDVRFGLIKWVALRWRNRTDKIWNASDQQNGPFAPILIFPHIIGRQSLSSVCLCRREGGSPLTNLEKKIIKHSFVFREVKE